MAVDSNCAFYQGPWIDGTLRALLIIWWQKNVRTKKTCVGAYMLTPTAQQIDWRCSDRLSAGLNPATWISILKQIATGIAVLKLSRLICPQCRCDPYLFPYKFSKIPKNNSRGLTDYYQSASREVRDLLRNEIEDKTRCEALRHCLRTLRSGFSGDRT